MLVRNEKKIGHLDLLLRLEKRTSAYTKKLVKADIIFSCGFTSLWFLDMGSWMTTLFSLAPMCFEGWRLCSASDLRYASKEDDFVQPPPSDMFWGMTTLFSLRPPICSEGRRLCSASDLRFVLKARKQVGKQTEKQRSFLMNCCDGNYARSSIFPRG